MYNHKWKILILLGLSYGLKKCYDLYVFVKPFLQLKNQLSSAGGLGDMLGAGPKKAGAPPIELTPSQKLLESIFQTSPIMKQHLKLFKTTIKNINMTLMFQPKYIQENLVEPHFAVKEAKLRTQEAGINGQQKMERWDALKNTLIKSIMAQIYCTRTVNLISTLQLSLTG